MRLVVDANVVVAALLKNATTRQILLVSDLGFFAPQHLLFEVRRLTKNRRFRNRLGVKEADLRDLISWIVRPITFVPEEMYVSFIRNALPLVAHHEDAPYIALSLALEAPLWSNDSALKKQTLVTVFTTSELVNRLNRK